MIEKPQYFLGLLALLFMAFLSSGGPSVDESAVYSADRLHIFEPRNVRDLSDRLPSTRSELSTGDLLIPNVAPARLPEDIQILSGTRLKMLFMRSLLPHILFQNEVIEEERDALLEYAGRIERGDEIPDRLKAAMVSLTQKYRVNTLTDSRLPGPRTVKRLLKRVDTIPVSLALAQAAHESGWGRSRFALEGNNLFGHWKTDGPEGMIPEARPEGERYSLAVFTTISEAVERYFVNLNTHPAYRNFREYRARMRERNMGPDPVVLVGTLDQYSERGQDYILDIVSLIRQNSLHLFDQAVLAGDGEASGEMITIYLRKEPVAGQRGAGSLGRGKKERA